MGTYPFPHLMRPVQAGSLVLKNRMLCTCCLPHFLQGPETFPSESIITFVENIAKAGAAIVTVPDRFDNTRGIPLPDVCRGPCWDPSDPSVGNYLSLMCECVHFQGSYITAQLSKFHSIPHDVSVCDGYEVPGPSMMTSLEPPPPPMPVKGITKEQMQALSDEIVGRANFYHSVGFDGIVLHCSYAYDTLAKFLPVATNKRTDEFGGPIENRAKFPLSVARRVKETCGQNFYIEMQISGDCMPEDELVRFAKLCEGIVDVLQIRLMDMDASHASTYNYDGGIPPTVKYAEIIKRSGAKVLAAPNGGLHDPEMNEKLIAEGKCDLVALARPFIADPHYGEKICNCRTEDIVPCLCCNKCHDHIGGLWSSACRVNPEMGIAHRLLPMVKAASEHKKRVAVIGGGPAGLRFALMAAEKGHQVTIYETGSAAGGQLLHADHAAFKWAMRDYKNYLIAQAEKDPNITLLLNTCAEPEMIAAENYDAVCAAVGSKPVVPALPGLETVPYLTPMDAFLQEDKIGKRVVVIGGGETGTETAMFLAEAGHEVTILSRGKYLARNAFSVHAYSLMKRRWEANPKLTFLPETAVNRVDPGAVTVTAGGETRVLPCDAIVVAGGSAPRSEEAVRFGGCAPEFYIIGDCSKAENLQFVNRSALAAAAKL